jgi:hypothetical protein
VVLGALVAGLVALGAAANHLAPVDPNDTRGPLDLRRVEMDGTDFPRWRVVTFGGWTAAEVWDLGYVTLALDTFDSSRTDYYVLVGSNGRQLYGHLWRDRTAKRDFKLATIDVWRMDTSSVSMRIPLDRLRVGKQRTFYRWRVETIFAGERCRRVCFDFAPDRGKVIEPLPVAPSPTVTPTPSVTSPPAP